MWKPHERIAKGQSKIQTGEERFIPGFHFMEDALKSFEYVYYTDIEYFLHETFIKGL